LPPALAHEVLDDGVELADAIDKFAGVAGIRDNQGAWGVLSNNLITRREAFRVALVAAFAPFYNVNLFRIARAAS
jgi:non-canonical (house-cleaning) NTP pyrophosphatase